MTQITTDNIESTSPPSRSRRALRNLAIGALVVAAFALIVSFLLLPVARAQGKTSAELPIGYQKSIEADSQSRLGA